MANIDPELKRLEETVRGARERLTQVIEKAAGPAAIEVATDICVETIAAVRAYLAKREEIHAERLIDDNIGEASTSWGCLR